MEAIGFGVMHVDEQDAIIDFVEKPADPPAMPGQPDMALASMGIYVFRTEFLVRPAAPRRRDARLQPRLRQGHHPRHRPARQGASPTASAPPASASSAEARRLLARRRHRRRLLGGQHRPDRHHPRARPLRHRLADLDLRRDQRRRPSSSTTRTAAAAAPSRASWCPATASSPAPRSAARCCSTGVRVHSYRRPRRGGDPARRRHRPPRPPPARGRRPRRPHPRGPRGRRGRRARRQALPPHRVGHLPHHPVDARRPEVSGPRRCAARARPSGAMMRVLSVASEAYPLVKTGGLADVAGALPPALARRGIEVRTLLPGYPAVMAEARRDPAPARLPRTPRRPRPPPRRHRRRPRPHRHRQPAALRPPRRPLRRPLRPRPPRQLAPLRRPRPRRRRHRHGPASRVPPRPRARPRLAGRPRARLPALLRRAAPLGDDHPQHRLPGRLPARRSSGAGAAAAGRRPRRRRVLRRRRLPQGRHRQRHRHHHRQPDLRRGDQDPGLRHGPRRPDLPPAPARCTASSTASTPTSGTPRPTRSCAATYSARKLPGRAAEPRRAAGRFGLAQRRHAALRPRQPPDLAEGHRPPRLDHRPGHRPRRQPPRRPRHRRRRPRAHLPRRSPPSSPAASAPSSATTSRSPT